MIVILNKGTMIEDVLISEFKQYLEEIHFSELYPVIGSVRITNEHPFALLLNQQSNGVSFTGQLFPCITVVSGSDEKVGPLTEYHDRTDFSLVSSDVSLIKEAGYQISQGSIDWLNAYFVDHETIYGQTAVGQRRDHITVEIWSENIQLKNELYNIVEMFLCGPKRDLLSTKHSITVTDDTVRGQRSGNYNLDFGQLLYGGQISFEADYLIEQSVLDTDIIDTNNDVILEVVNHVRTG